jgi:hypothetical protein
MKSHSGDCITDRISQIRFCSLATKGEGKSLHSYKGKKIKIKISKSTKNFIQALGRKGLI